MDVKLANLCMSRGFPVYCDGRKYARINAIISRQHVAGEQTNTGRRTQVELYDGESNAVIIADVDKIHIDMEDDDESAE